MKRSNFLSLALALTMCAGMSVPTHAASSIDVPGDLSSEVNLSAAAATFSVSVPTRLPISIAADGSVTTASNAAIVNSSNGPVKVNEVKVQAKNGWSIAAWGKDFRSTPTGAKEFTMQLNNAAVAENGSVALAGFPVIPGGDRLALTYDADAAVQSSAINEEIAEIVITVDWAENTSSDSTGSSSDEVVEAEDAITFILDGASYQAATGSTWDAWFKSEYNTPQFSKTTPVYDSSLLPVSLNDVITPNGIYHLTMPTHSGGSNN